jgi:hypothetical protein
MREEGLGPNGAMLYCMEYLEQNLDWLVDGLKELDGDYFVFDVPGQVGSTAWYPVMRSLGCDPDSSDCLSYFTSLQVELSTNHHGVSSSPGLQSASTFFPSRILLQQELTPPELILVLLICQLAAVHLTDSSHIVEPAKYISILILSLRTMLQLEMPHINVLTKMDILRSFGTLGESSSFSLPQLSRPQS